MIMPFAWLWVANPNRFYKSKMQRTKKTLLPGGKAL